MRRVLTSHRLALTAGVAVAALLAVGCSSGTKNAASSSTAAGSGSASGVAPTGPVGTATVTGAFDKEPVVTIGIGRPPTTTQVTVVSKGTGRPLQVGDLAVVDDYGRTWRTATAFQDTFGATTPPDTLPVGTGTLGLTGLDKALVGVPAGSRVLVILPPADGFGRITSLPTGVSQTDTAVFVFDVRDGFTGKQGPTGTAVSASPAPGLPTVSGVTDAKPVITIPKVPPTTLTTTTLIQGSGPVAAKGDELVVQYVGQIWATGKEFDSSWKRSSPVGFAIGVGRLIPAWDQGLVGVKAGSRVLIVAPPASGYGSAGQPQAGISGTDTLVFVVDVLGAYPAA